MTEESASSPISYSERIVAFVDILGFTELVKEADVSSQRREMLVQALSRVRAVKPLKGLDKDPDLRVQNFSDSLIMSAERSPIGFFHLIFAIDALIFSLLQMGVFVRGAVTVGRIYHNETMVFGIGMNEAYRLESNIAIMPRVILSYKAYDYVKSLKDQIWIAYREELFLRDNDGVWFLHFLRDFQWDDDENLLAIGDRIRAVIQHQFHSMVDRPSVYSKIEWVAKYWNHRVVGPASEGRQTWRRINLAGKI
jgi:hypothetical protein